MTEMSRVCQECIGLSESVCELALTSICEDLECDDNQLIPRRRLADSHIKHNPMVHWGIFGSADTVLKSAMDRDRIAGQYGVGGFEMEATGTCDIFPCIVIKGACDYADSHKNKEWQNYAAITAACVMKTLLQWYPKTIQRTPPPVGREVQTKLQVGSTL